MDAKLVRQMGWIAVATTALMLLALLVLYGTTPGWGASGSSIITFYTAHSTRQLWAFGVTGAALFGVLLYGGVLAQALRQLTGQRIWPLVAFGGAVATLAGSLVGGIATLALIEGARGHVTIAGAEGLNALVNANPLALQAGMAVLMGFASLALLTGLRTAQGRRPAAWLGWLGLVLAVAILVNPVFVLGFGAWSIIAGFVVPAELRAASGQASSRQPIREVERPAA